MAMYGFVVCQLALALWAKNSNHQHFAVNTGVAVACPLVASRLDKPLPVQNVKVTFNGHSHSVTIKYDLTF